MAQLVSSRFFLTRQNSCPAVQVGKQKEQLGCSLCLHVGKLLTVGNFVQAANRKGHWAYPGHPQANLSGTWDHVEGEPETSGASPAPGRRQQSWMGGLSWSWKAAGPRTPPGSPARNNGPFHCVRPRVGKSEHHRCSVLSYGTTFLLLSEVNSGSPNWTSG